MSKTTTGPYSILLTEDDPLSAEILKQYISKVKFLAPPLLCGTGMDTLQHLLTNPVDILFLDLGLPDMCGLDVLRALPTQPIVIVTSSHTELAVDCYDLDVMDFLPKPYDFNRFLRAISRVMKRTQSEIVVETKGGIEEPAGTYMKTGRRVEHFAYSDILYVEAYGIYSKIHTVSGVLAVNKRISVLAQELPQDRFMRIHKSFIINTAYLKRMGSKQLWIKSTKLPIGITYQPGVHERFQKFGINPSAS